MSSETRVTTRTTPPEVEPSLGSLVSQLAQDSSTLIKQEIALAKAEVRYSVKQTASGAVKLGVAAALLLLGGLVLTAFVVILLGELLGNYWLAALIVGLIYTIIGALLALAGMRRLKEVQLAPAQTLDTLKADKTWAGAQIRQVKQGLKS